tara:strand:- start:135 stop:377 length:243 start_codon:yes stop_codon:yes gene_type:complete
MIDTDKYEGHTPADEWESHLIDALFETEFPMTYADNQLMADAPKLLAEVKRLREGIEHALILSRDNNERVDKLRELMGWI